MQWVLLVSVDVSVLCSPLPEVMEIHKDLEACPCFWLGILCDMSVVDLIHQDHEEFHAVPFGKMIDKAGKEKIDLSCLRMNSDVDGNVIAGSY